MELFSFNFQLILTIETNEIRTRINSISIFAILSVGRSECHGKYFNHVQVIFITRRECDFNFQDIRRIHKDFKIFIQSYINYIKNRNVNQNMALTDEKTFLIRQFYLFFIILYT